MFSSTSDHAIRATLVLARRYGSGPLHADEIADATGAPRNYMGKTLHALARAGIVHSSRGPTGGFVLAVPPETLTIARVVDLFDEPRPHARCLHGTGPCNPAAPCAAHDRWTALLAARRTPLTATTFADLLGAGLATDARADGGAAVALPPSFTLADAPAVTTAV